MGVGGGERASRAMPGKGGTCQEPWPEKLGRGAPPKIPWPPPFSCSKPQHHPGHHSRTCSPSCDRQTRTPRRLLLMDANLLVLLLQPSLILGLYTHLDDTHDGVAHSSMIVLASFLCALSVL